MSCRKSASFCAIPHRALNLFDDMSNHDLQHPLADPDLLHLVLLQSGIDFDYDVQKPNSDRANLRLRPPADAEAGGLCRPAADVRRSGAKDRCSSTPPTGNSNAPPPPSIACGPLRKLPLDMASSVERSGLATILAAATAVAVAVAVPSLRPAPAAPACCAATFPAAVYTRATRG